MHQAQVNAWGEPPKYTEVDELPAPGPDQVRIKVLAAGIHRVVRSRAAGRHYTSGALPHLPGTDGIGVTDEGQHVYFNTMPEGCMSEYINAEKQAVQPLPAGLDPFQAAALINPTFSSWMAFKSRTNDLPTGFNVLIMGATSTSGRIAIQLARAFGASRIIGLARNKQTLETLDIDDAIVVPNDVEQTDFSTLGEIDVIIDYFYGPLTTHLFKSLPKSKRAVQYVHVGVLSGVHEIMVPGPILRSKNLTIRGSGPGAFDPDRLDAEMPDILKQLAAMPNLPPVKVMKLSEVEQAWADTSSERIVLVP